VLRIVGAGLVVAVVAACTSDARTTSSTPTGTLAAPAAPTSCEAPLSPAGSGLVERQGVGTDATVWALFFLDAPRITANSEVKVAWRMSGDGRLSIVATGPSGRTVRPVWGPEQHSSSTWTRPGEEWGTGWVFPEPGCWTITLTRDRGRGRLSVPVGKPATP
jgi:hypothetical protein